MNAEMKVNTVKLNHKSVYIEWSDGHKSSYDCIHLRANCACAECVEEWSNRKLLDPMSIPSDIKAEDYLMIGRYAIQFLWSDAHFTGIYTFELLRTICQCAQCKMPIQ